eukprot:249296-Hanusia_phi.AAC.2
MSLSQQLFELFQLAFDLRDKFSQEVNKLEPGPRFAHQSQQQQQQQQVTTCQGLWEVSCCPWSSSIAA